MKLKHIFIFFNLILCIVLFIEPALSLIGFILVNIIFVSVYFLKNNYLKDNNKTTSYHKYLNIYNETKQNLNIPNNAVSIFCYTSELNFICNYSYTFWINDDNLYFFADEPDLINFEEFECNSDKTLIKLEVDKINNYYQSGEQKTVEKPIEVVDEVTSLRGSLFFTILTGNLFIGKFLGRKKVKTTEIKKEETDTRRLIINYNIGNESLDLIFGYNLYEKIKDELPLKNKEIEVTLD